MEEKIFVPEEKTGRYAIKKIIYSIK